MTLSVPAAAPRAPARISRHAWAMLWVLPLPAWLLLFFAVPLGLLAAMSFWSVVNYRLTPDATLSAWRYVLGLEFLWVSFWRSYGLAMASALLVSLLAFPASYAMAFLVGPRKRLLLLGLALAPFFTSYLVRVYSWQVFLAEGGVFTALARALGGEGHSLLNTYFAVFLGHASLALPVVLILQTIALANVDRTQISAAANLGARPVAILARVILPAARPGLALGVLFAFLLSYAEFVSAAYLGGGAFQTLPILVTDLVRSGQQWPRAAVVSLLMIATLLTSAIAIVLWAYRQKG